jgi:hypothetical protein
MTGVYLLLDNDYNLCKIGQTSALKKRVRDLSCFYNFDLSESIFLFTTSPIKLETTLHFLFNEFLSHHPNGNTGCTEFFAQTDKFFNMMSYFLKKFEAKEKFIVYSISDLL